MPGSKFLKTAISLLVLLFSALVSFSQTDSLQLFNSVDKLLKKSGYKDAKFELRVITNSDKDGSPVFAINNFQNKTDTQKVLKQRHPDIDVLYRILSQLPSRSAKIKFLVSGGKESENYSNEIYRELTNRGYKNISGSHWMYPDGFDKVETKMEEGVLSVMICPSSEVKEE